MVDCAGGLDPRPRPRPVIALVRGRNLPRPRDVLRAAYCGWADNDADAFVDLDTDDATVIIRASSTRTAPRSTAT
jgi:hypothetical protein